MYSVRTWELVCVGLCEVEHVFVGVDDLEAVFERLHDRADVEVLRAVVQWLLRRRLGLGDARALQELASDDSCCVRSIN